MSIVPNDSLQSADSLQLPIFGMVMNIDSAVNKIDIYTRYKAFWKSCVIRNTQTVDNIQYRTGQGEFLSLNANSEIKIKGWGSYLEVLSSATTPEGNVVFECVRIKDAMKNV